MISDLSRILSIQETTNILQYFPSIELSYETISHKKVFLPYEIGLAIPHGRKFYAWFSFYKNQDVLYLIELNKEKKITHVLLVPVKNYDQDLFFGTLFYGVVLSEKFSVDSPIYPENKLKKKFIIEDIFNYRGIPMKKNTFGEKLPWIFDFIKNWRQQHTNDSEIDFLLPAMWHYDVKTEPVGNEGVLPQKYKSLPYNVHHIQYRCLNEIVPLLNYQVTKNLYQAPFMSIQIQNQNQNQMQFQNNYVNYRANFMKPQYQYKTIFKVMADIQFDIYHLFAYGKNKTSVYYNIAYIPNYETSVFMNNLFRNIKENKNLDYIEESDDEDDFQNISEDKYVNLQKVLFIECKFHPKFKKWVPLKVVQQPCKVVHISML